MDSNELATSKKRLGPNASVLVAPKVVTKSALVREAQTREQLRKEFLVMQEIVKATEFLIPFVFYDGTNIPGGVCKVKKGDHAWLFLDRSRKVGAELGVSGGGSSGGGGGGGGTAEKSSNRREWARVGVDDLMLVRGEIIIPHVRPTAFNRNTSTNVRWIALRVLLLHRQQNAWPSFHPSLPLLSAADYCGFTTLGHLLSCAFFRSFILRPTGSA